MPDISDEDFYDRFIRLLKNIQEKLGLETIHDALIVWFGENFLFLDPEDVKERIVKDSHAEGIDSVLIDQTNYGLYIVQAKGAESFEITSHSFPENEVKSTLGGVRFVLRESYKGKITPELENLVDEFHELERTGDYSAKVVFLALKQPPDDDKFIVAFRKDFPTVNVEFLDFQKLKKLYSDQYLIKIAPPPDTVSFDVVENILNKNQPSKARVFITKGKDLAKIYDTFKERIFQQNVRYFLGSRSKSINAQILTTAKDENQSKNFWYFNNGVTIVCKEIRESVSAKVIHLDKAQIINGAQTTYALYDAYTSGKLRDDAEVLIKAIQTDDRKLIENVTLYTNSQNAIKLRDLCSNDDVQVILHRILLETYGYFFERKRGELDSEYQTPKSKEELLGTNYKAKVMSNENAAQSILAMFLSKPAQAKSEKGRIFLKDGGFYDDIFNPKDKVLAEKVLGAWKLLRFIEARKGKYKEEYKKADKLEGEQQKNVYRFDFLLHSEYFILNLFRDFLKNFGLDVSKRDDVLKVNDIIDRNNDQLQKIYETIVNKLAAYIDSIRGQQGYYHNKFFKNEKSIGLVRNFFATEFNFVEVI
jgi:hypothetical protein